MRRLVIAMVIALLPFTAGSAQAAEVETVTVAVKQVKVKCHTNLDRERFKRAGRYVRHGEYTYDHYVPSEPGEVVIDTIWNEHYDWGPWVRHRLRPGDCPK